MPTHGWQRKTMPAEILVLGAGVSGLTCALVLLERGRRVTLRARDEPLETTSAVAAALWYPFEAAPAERVERWAVRSLARFSDLAARARTGVILRSLVDLHSPAVDVPGWAMELEERRELAGADLRGFEQGWSARVPVVEMPLYLPWLTARVRDFGGRLERAEVRSLEETRGFDAVVNCTGLGARELLGDAECFPIRGQVARVPRGAVERSLVFQRADGSFGYVIPRSRDCVLGGTAERRETSLEPDPAATRSILERCRALEPRIDPTVTGVAVGLRPGRSAIRLERERMSDGRPLVHDYGHGGCGVTLSWACAEEAVALVEEALE